MLGPGRFSQRRACQVPGPVPDDESRLVGRMVELATQYAPYGYRRVAALMRAEGLAVNHKRVERLWRRKGLKVPQRRPKRGRIWLNDGSCDRLRPERKNQSGATTSSTRGPATAFRMLNVIDEYTRECLAIDVARKPRSDDVLERLSGLFVRRGVPGPSALTSARSSRRRPCGTRW